MVFQLDSVFVAYKTDTWHAYDSRKIIGIGSNLNTAVDLCKAKAKDEGYKLKKNTVMFLLDKLQTQDYKGDGEFQIEEFTLNQYLP